ncbi:hypothetical protein F4677DRAFT_50528 [Hypoxylon crocopeplum]|nr:hypothetical protein F4677DRAFT_50528 [Hypoxylon crocopeplum]
MYRVSSDHASLDIPRPNVGGQRSSSPVEFSMLRDPRSSSTQSLVPTQSEEDESGRRRLLIVYVHGFMGNDASFQSFPAHVHHYLKLALADTHVIHSKIYPRYKTYKSLDVARDNFSIWLAPHESPTTDIVLVGHSMGGLLAADVALMPPRNQYRPGYFLHRILGTVGLDAPYLGLHPSVITAGIASLFRPKSDVTGLPEKPVPDDETIQPLSNINSASASIYSDPSSASQASLPYPPPPGTFRPYGVTFDPNFNPSFPNDVRLQDRGWWKNIVHFVEKHNAEGLFDAASYHLMSHLEFGGCLLDGNNLRTRYENIRKLEDVDDLKHHGFPHVPPQVRFVQYYTVCHGYPKTPKGQDSNHNSEVPGAFGDTRSAPPTPHISVQSHDDALSPQTSMDVVPEGEAPPRYALSADSESLKSLELLAPEPISEEIQPTPESDPFSQPLVDAKDKNAEHIIPAGYESNPISDSQHGHENPLSQESSEKSAVSTELTDTMASLDLGLDLPAIPELPMKPESPDLNQYTDKDVRKQAEKEAKRVQKDYAKLVKDRAKAIKERQKLVDKRKKKLAQEAEKRDKEEQKRRKKEAASASSISEEGPSRNVFDPSSAQLDASLSPGKPPKQPKERKFCNVDKENGHVDSKWVKIFMKDTDQVGAHTGLFFKGEHYERLVGDMGETIVKWAQDDMTKRAVLEMQ